MAKRGHDIWGTVLSIRFAIIRCNRRFINIRDLTSLLPIVYITQAL